MIDLNKLFNKVDVETGFLYLLNKMSNTTRKSDRIQLYQETLKFLTNENIKNVDDIKIFNIFCPLCGDSINQETGLCDNCESCKQVENK